MTCWCVGSFSEPTGDVTRQQKGNTPMREQWPPDLQYQTSDGSWRDAKDLVFRNKPPAVEPTLLVSADGKTWERAWLLPRCEHEQLEVRNGDRVARLVTLGDEGIPVLLDALEAAEANGRLWELRSKAAQKTIEYGIGQDMIVLVEEMENLRADRDRWKARAETAEADVDGLRSAYSKAHGILFYLLCHPEEAKEQARQFFAEAADAAVAARGDQQ